MRGWPAICAAKTAQESNFGGWTRPMRMKSSASHRRPLGGHGGPRSVQPAETCTGTNRILALKALASAQLGFFETLGSAGRWSAYDLKKYIQIRTAFAKSQAGTGSNVKALAPQTQHHRFQLRWPSQFAGARHKHANLASLFSSRTARAKIVSLGAPGLKPPHHSLPTPLCSNSLV